MPVSSYNSQKKTSNDGLQDSLKPPEQVYTSAEFRFDWSFNGLINLLQLLIELDVTAAFFMINCD